ncbi:hypothetical protein ASG73_06635 [Janibacter sp. Soil728]|uniref:hypothetical protein n=1 Tax=Janibacter sp. Soil728 TaxID=1736393 RepID=UPI0006F33FFB|nr:hypothetical protein [Janibacter sp. Soil728]KRE38593.1 hypothetical protein ASG73_06635 [Janibacter sp. Soil728]
MSRTNTPFVATVIALPVLLGGCGVGTSLAGIHDAPAEKSGGASISSDSASTVSKRVIADAVSVSRQSGKAHDTARDKALSGLALREVDAAVTSKDRQSRASKEVKGLKVLAVSRGKDWPRAVLATSQTKDVQYLHVLVSQAADQPYTLFADVPMAAGASVPALAPLEEGAPAKLTKAPSQDVTAAADSWAKGVAFPAAKKAPKDVSVSDGFSAALKKNAKKTSRELGKLAEYRQSQALAKGESVQFELDGGGSLTFVPMTRTDTVTATKKLKELKIQQPALKHVLDASTVKKSLTVKHVETIAFVTPAEGKSRVVAASDVLHSAKGR